MDPRCARDDRRRFPWGDEEASCERAVMGEACGRDGSWEVRAKHEDVSPYGVQRTRQRTGCPPHDAAECWYLEDGSGRRFDGAFEAGEKKSVLVVGYFGEPVKPGTRIDADIQLGALSFQRSTLARRRWRR